MQIGLLTYRDWAKPWQHESDLIERALDRWLRKAAAELQMFQFGIAYSDHRADDVNAHFGWRGHDMPGQGHISFTLYRVGDRPFYTLSDGITALETAVEGLGETTMHYLTKIEANTVPMLTPRTALYLAQQAYWMGEEDETQLIEDELAQLEEGYNPEHLDIYRLRDFLAEIPEWVALPKQRHTPTSLRRIARDLPGTDAGQVAALLLKIPRACAGAWTPNTLDESMESTEVAAELIWSTKDDCGQIFDDAMEQTFNNGESTDDFGSAYMPPEAGPIKAWLRSAEKTFRLLRLCEQLVRIVGKPVRH